MGPRLPSRPANPEFIETDFRDGDEVRLIATDTMINLDDLYRDARITDRRQTQESEHLIESSFAEAERLGRDRSYAAQRDVGQR